MSGLFGGKSDEEREAKKRQKEAQLEGRQTELANRYDDMVTKALERLTRWAFPDSQVEREEGAEWQLWHTADDGEKYVDVTVTLYFEKGEATCFMCDGPLYLASAELTREDLDTGLRQCISSVHG